MTLVVANWKMNLGYAQAKRWLAVVGPELSRFEVEVLVLPSFPLLPLLQGQRPQRLLVGAQNAGPAASGAYTGEVSPVLLKELGCTHVLLGHSERRFFFGESPELVARRTAAALEAGLSPIVCVGEGIGEERQAVLERQLAPLKPWAERLILAYEPLFAIGSGRPASVDDARAARELIARLLDRTAPVLYGGSVTAENARCFLREAGMDGLLVGTSSLDPTGFVGLLEAIADAT